MRFRMAVGNLQLLLCQKGESNRECAYTSTKRRRGRLQSLALGGALSLLVLVCAACTSPKSSPESHPADTTTSVSSSSTTSALPTSSATYCDLFQPNGNLPPLADQNFPQCGDYPLDANIPSSVEPSELELCAQSFAAGQPGRTASQYLATCRQAVSSQEIPTPRYIVYSQEDSRYALVVLTGPQVEIFALAEDQDGLWKIIYVPGNDEVNNDNEGSCPAGLPHDMIVGVGQCS